MFETSIGKWIYMFTHRYKFQKVYYFIVTKYFIKKKLLSVVVDVFYFLQPQKILNIKKKIQFEMQIPGTDVALRGA